MVHTSKLRKWRQEDPKFETNLSYVAKPCLKNKIV